MTFLMMPLKNMNVGLNASEQFKMESEDHEKETEASGQIQVVLCVLGHSNNLSGGGASVCWHGVSCHGRKYKFFN